MMSGVLKFAAIAPRLSQPALTRGMATEKQILMRIKATNNIGKITKSMKMVSAAKLRGDTERMKVATPFVSWSNTLFGEEQDVDENAVELAGKAGDNTLMVLVTSDRGLCGSVNSSITRVTGRFTAEMKKQEKPYSLYVLGEKGRSQIGRRFSKDMGGCITGYSKGVKSFASVCGITESLVQHEFSSVYILFNKFINSLTNLPHIKAVERLEYDADEEVLVDYDFEPEPKEELLQDLMEYNIASSLYYGVMHGATSEQSTRMTAMENATKNAGEMVQKLTMQYNRARQSRITTELIEIISGAAALESSDD